MEIKSYSQTHIGLKRKSNQDSILIDSEIKLFAIADGMGGHKGGAIASSLAIKTLQEYVRARIKLTDFNPEKTLVEGFKTANKMVLDKSKESLETLTGMGTTLTACLFWDNTCFFVNVGDSRAYLFKDPYLWRITEDHSVISHQIKKRLITEEQVHLFADANVITRSIGFLPAVEVDLFKRKFAKKNLFLLCSDGLHGMINDKELSELCKKYPPEDIAEQCIQSSLDAGGNDNISVIIISS